MNQKWIVLLFALMHVGCSSTTTPTFTVVPQPLSLKVRVTETASVNILVNRSNGFAEPVTVTLEGETTGLEVEPLVLTGNEGTLKFRITDAAKIGTSFPVIQAVSGSVIRNETLTLRIEKAVANIAEITIENNGGSTQVRQGLGDITLVVTGSNFERVTSLSVGDLDTSILEQTPSRLELQIAIPHAAPLGAKDLVLTTEGGAVTEKGILTVTGVTAGPLGNDTTGVGTADRPYRTLNHALSLAQSGDTVKLLKGVYDAASGEVWPQLADTTLTPGPNIPLGIHIEGEGFETILEGPGRLNNHVGLGLAGDNSVANLTVKNFATAMVASEGDITLSNVKVEANDYGLTVMGNGHVVIDVGEFTANLLGINALNEASLELRGGSSHDNANGVGVGNSARLSAKDFESHHNLNNGFDVGGDASLLLERTNVYNNGGIGLLGYQQANVVLQASEIYDNFGGINFRGATLHVRGTTIRDNSSFGVYIEAQPSKVDFGNFLEPGNNVLENNRAGNPDALQLLDARTARATLGEVDFTVSATTFNGVKPAPAIYPLDGTWPYLNPPYFSILYQNNVIQFF